MGPSGCEGCIEDLVDLEVIVGDAPDGALQLVPRLDLHVQLLPNLYSTVKLKCHRGNAAMSPSSLNGSAAPPLILGCIQIIGLEILI